MDSVKLPPLLSVHRARDGMTQQACTSSEALFAGCKRFIHFGHVVECFRQDLGAVPSARGTNVLRGLRRLAESGPVQSSNFWFARDIGLIGSALLRHGDFADLWIIPSQKNHKQHLPSA